MTDAPSRRRIRPEAVWAEVRRAWEGGETARSAARRYDVGVHALWKRREAVQVGLDQIERGEVVEVTDVRALLAEIEAEVEAGFADRVA